MTKLEELKAAYDAASEVADAADDAWDAYYDEVKKQAKTPREPVEGEGNPLV
jgi:hypothetical protein